MIKFVDDSGAVVYELKDEASRPTTVSSICHKCGRDFDVQYNLVTNTATFKPCECQQTRQETQE